MIRSTSNRTLPIFLLAVFAVFLGRCSAQEVTASVNGIKNQSIGLAGMQPLYNPDGTPISGGKCVQAIVTSTATGTWTVDYTAMAFKTITSFRAQASNPATGVGLLMNQFDAHPNPPSLTTFSGYITNSVAVSVATVSVPILQFSSQSVQVSVGVCGTT